MAKTKNNSRGYKPRTVNTREIKQRFLIVCEGEKTEPNYFKAFRVPKDVKLVVRGLGQNPSNLMDQTKKWANQEDEDYNQIWCVFDRDSWTTEDFNNALTKAKNEGIQVAYSNEAFEL